MNELKEFMKEGGAKVFTQYAVNIGDNLWNSLYSYIENKYPVEPKNYCSVYRIEGVCEDGEQKFAVLKNKQDEKYYRMDFSLDAENFVPSDTLIEVTDYAPAAEPQFALNAVEEFENEYASKKKAEEDKNNKSNNPDGENKSEGNDNKKNPDNGEPSNKSDKGNNGENDDDDKKKKKNYSLEDVVEYTELKAQYDELQTKFAALETENNSLKEQIAPLAEFMLSDEDKADVVENIDKYSLDDIEAKLSVICVRNKVSFDLDENNKPNGATTFNLNNNGSEDDDMPAWVKAAFATANKN